MKRFSFFAMLMVGVIGVTMMMMTGSGWTKSITGWEREGLRGRVKTVTFDQGQEKRRTMTHFFSDGSLQSQSVYESDQLRKELTYEAKGRIAQAIYWDQEFEYGYEGENVSAWKDGKLVGEGKMDGYGNIIALKSEFKVIEVLAYDHEYLGLGMPKNILTNGHFGVTFSEYSYTSKGQVERIKISAINQPVIEVEYDYDDKGRLIREGQFQQFTRYYTYLEFDKKGNWIKREMLYSGRGLTDRKIETRTISYWE